MYAFYVSLIDEVLLSFGMTLPLSAFSYSIVYEISYIVVVLLILRSVWLFLIRKIGGSKE